MRYFEGEKNQPNPYRKGVFIHVLTSVEASITDSVIFFLLTSDLKDFNFYLSFLGD